MTVERFRKLTRVAVCRPSGCSSGSFLVVRLYGEAVSMGGLQHEIKQKKGFASPEEEAFLNLQRTADALARSIQETLKPAGLSLTQYNVLRILRGAGLAGLACSEIGGRMLTHDPDVTRLLDRLEARRLVSRSRKKDDRRVITTHITNQGTSVVRQLERPIQEALKRRLGHFTEAQLRLLTKLLELARRCGQGGATGRGGKRRT